MPKYTYKAKDLEGNDRTGTVETVDEHQVARVISKKGWIVISIKETNSKKGEFLQKYLNKAAF